MATQEDVFSEISTEAEAQAHILEQIARLKRACNVEKEMQMVGTALKADRLKLAYAKYHILLGKTLGSLVTLMHCRKLSNENYIKLKARLIKVVSTKLQGALDDLT